MALAVVAAGTTRRYLLGVCSGGSEQHCMYCTGVCAGHKVISEGGLWVFHILMVGNCSNIVISRPCISSYYEGQEVEMMIHKSPSE
jgi:hypothetical protein